MTAKNEQIEAPKIEAVESESQLSNKDSSRSKSTDVTFDSAKQDERRGDFTYADQARENKSDNASRAEDSLEGYTITPSTGLDELISFGTPDDIRARYISLNERAEKSDFGPFDCDVVVVDTETTGLSFKSDELIQIAAARMAHGKITDWYVTFVNPGKELSDDIVHLTGITYDDIKDAPTPEEALTKLTEFIGSSYVVAHNAEFDRTFCTGHPQGYPLLENIWIDSLDLARIALPRLKGHRLLDLVHAFGAPVSTHRADDDVAATCAVFRVLLAAVAAMPRSLVRQIAQLAPVEEWPTVVVFDYFAHQEIDEAGADAEYVLEKGASLSQKDANACAEKTTASLKSTESFSLRTCRHARIKAMQARIAQQQFALQNSDMVQSKQDSGDSNSRGECDFANKRTSSRQDAWVLMESGEELIYPTPYDIEDIFADEGPISKLYDVYESRSEQIQMSLAITEAFAASENLLVEAGTGVGKSLAYLVPSVLLAQRNAITVGVATKTNALLDQLIYHELPALNEAIGPVSYIALKGFSHYPCLRRIERLAYAKASQKEINGKDVSTAPAVAALLSFIEQTEYDDLDNLKINKRLVPISLMTTTSRDCLRKKCPYFGKDCFVHGVRQRASQVDIVVTNHSLLFCDLVADGGLLPPIRYWVVDESHGAEAEARRAFSQALSSEELNRMATRVASLEPSRNVFLQAKRLLERESATKTESSETLAQGLISKAMKAGEAFDAAVVEYTQHVKDLLYFQPKGSTNKGYEFSELWVNNEIRLSERFQALSEIAAEFMDAAEKLVRASQDLVGVLEDFPSMSAVQREIASLALGVKEAIMAADVIFSHPTQGFAYSATISKKKDRLNDSLEALMLDVGDALRETLYARTESVIFASATLCVGGSFDAAAAALGLAGGGGVPAARTLALPSSFDFDNNMTIYVVNDIPEPTQQGYLDALTKFLVDVHVAQGGSMLTLFTNRKEMELCYNSVYPQIKQADLRLVCQKWGVNFKALRDDFIKEESLSLFALKSFWEGFDAPGDSLRGVVIPKLPFSKPTDPLSCERGQRDQHAWAHYVLPAAILEVKQAVGRLIRTATDSGVIIFADKRLLTKSYGKVVLRSMPSKNILSMSREQIVKALDMKRRLR